MAKTESGRSGVSGKRAAAARSVAKPVRAEARKAAARVAGGRPEAREVAMRGAAAREAAALRAANTNGRGGDAALRGGDAALRGGDASLRGGARERVVVCRSCGKRPGRPTAILGQLMTAELCPECTKLRKERIRLNRAAARGWRSSSF